MINLMLDSHHRLIDYEVDLVSAEVSQWSRGKHGARLLGVKIGASKHYETTINRKNWKTKFELNSTRHFLQCQDSKSVHGRLLLMSAIAVQTTSKLLTKSKEVILSFDVPPTPYPLL